MLGMGRRGSGVPGKKVDVLKPARSAVFSALNGLAAMLTVLLIVEIYSGLRPAGELPGLRLPAQPAGAQAGPRISSPALSGWRASVLARPLFDPSRRPPAAVSQAPAIPVEIPRLSGIMITSTEKMAVFSPAAGSPIIVAVKSQLGPFTVLAITGDSVTLNGPDGVVVLRSKFSPVGQIKLPQSPDRLPGGIVIDLTKVPPSYASWAGPPMVN
jgi:general secretion pathway protein N